MKCAMHMLVSSCTSGFDFFTVPAEGLDHFGKLWSKLHVLITYAMKSVNVTGKPRVRGITVSSTFSAKILHSCNNLQGLHGLKHPGPKVIYRNFFQLTIKFKLLINIKVLKLMV